MPVSKSRPRLRIRDLLTGALLVLGNLSCDHTTTGPPDPGDATYPLVYDPPRLVYSTANCDRFLTHAVTSLGRRNHDFDLSINVTQDCSRAGGGFAYWEVLILGHYSVVDTMITFKPASSLTLQFTGTFDANYIRLTLPPRPDSLAPSSLALELGPKIPF